MDHFTPISAAIGGMLIGLSAVMLWLGIGRIAGISGILGYLPTAGAGDRAWRVAFLFGLIVAPLVYRAAGGVMPPMAVTSSSAYLIPGGLLVGFGTRLGSGCTSGHAVCGIARFSRRSQVATLIFMVCGFATVCITRHLLGG